MQITLGVAARKVQGDPAWAVENGGTHGTILKSSMCFVMTKSTETTQIVFCIGSARSNSDNMVRIYLIPIKIFTTTLAGLVIFFP